MMIGARQTAALQLLDRAADRPAPAAGWHLLQLLAAAQPQPPAAAHPPFPGPGDGHRRRRALLLQVVPARVHGLPFLALLLLHLCVCGADDRTSEGEEREEEGLPLVAHAVLLNQQATRGLCFCSGLQGEDAYKDRTKVSVQPVRFSLFSRLISHQTVFFSHNKSTVSTFQPAYKLKLTG
nr:uncharacterized protein LOC117848512 [Setaria viridis]